MVQQYSDEVIDSETYLSSCIFKRALYKTGLFGERERLSGICPTVNTTASTLPADLSSFSMNPFLELIPALSASIP
jgi:hypothetical protein